MSLRERLKAQIRAEGPMTVAQYMTACLYDPADGYYARRPALGETGDFVTAPLVSQMFGEMIGLWAMECWDRLGRPARVRLIELGPGDGTLMGDILRTARVLPTFREAVDVWLVEVSEPLIARQRERLGDEARWASALDLVPGEAPAIIVANELLDCLPVQQFARTATGWAQRQVGLNDAGELAFGLVPVPSLPALGAAPEGAVREVSPAQEALGAEIGGRIARDGGAALLIDYGRDEPGFGDTLQAVKGHERVSPLDGPGEADLTAHVDFPGVLAAAQAEGAETSILTQGAFLGRLGIEARAAALAKARPDQAEKLARQLDRLIGAAQMGSLFKAAAIVQPGLAAPGFEACA